MTRNSRRTATSLAAILTSLLLPALAASPEEIKEGIRSSSLDPARAVGARNLEIDMGEAILFLEQGVFIPTAPIAGQTMEFVFDGRARFIMEPPDDIEAQQLELFTNEESLDVEINQAVLVIGEPAVSKRLLDRDAVTDPDPEALKRATALFEQWLEGTERRGFGADGAIFKAAHGDVPARGYFAVWCKSEELGDFYYLFDPFSVEQVALGQFVKSEIDEIDKHMIERYVRKQKRRGRFSQFRVADLGDWDTWVSTALPLAEGGFLRGSHGIEPEHYVIDLHVIGQEQKVEGKTRIDLRSASDGRSALTLELFSDLKIRSIRDGEGRELSWYRTGEEAHVVLAETVNEGDRFSIEVEYAGVLFNRLEAGIFSLRDTYSWYPRTGTVDRATYEATLRWPKGNNLLASGRVVEEGVEGGKRWQRRTLEIPAIAFSLEYGDFDVRHARAGHVDITIAFSKASYSWDKGAKKDIVEAVTEALPFFEERFGAYPLDYLTVVTVPRGFSQGFLGFMTISHDLLAMPRGWAWIVVSGQDESYDQLRRDYRYEVLAHELSHQWWGNKVGWVSYRDQWLSESLATFSATLFVAHKAEVGIVYLARHGKRWKIALRSKTKEGHPTESLGPVVLGQRLFSSKSERAYHAIVYDKGAAVLAMLARGLQAGPFQEMLGALANAVNHRNIDTPTFISAIQKMSGIELTEFADKFIYGTGLPEVLYEAEFVEQHDGSWVVEGTARQIPPMRYSYKLLKDDSGRWNISREKLPSVDVADYFLVVPFQIALEGEKPEENERQRKTDRYGVKTYHGLGGQMLVQGETTQFSIPLEQEPSRFWLDQGGEVLATFLPKRQRPKEILLYEASKLTGEEEERLLKEALNASYLSEGALEETDYTEREIERYSRLMDAEILLRLAQIYLDQGRDDEARQAFEDAMSKITGVDRGRRLLTARMLLESRFDIREGNFKSAYSRLSSKVRLRLPRRFDDSLRELARYKKFRSGRTVSGDGYALLALSAHMTDHDYIARLACEEAEERGADMTELREIMPQEGEE